MVQGPENQALDLNQRATKAAILQMANVRPTGRSVTEPDSKEEQLINETVQLLTEGDTRISLDTVYKFFFLVVGITGAGKSTITNCLTNIKNLYSYEARDRFIIKDKDEKISGEEASIVSRTTFPELLVDESNKVAFYDLPGFCDTRTAAIEIANAWFMRKVACHAEKVKLLFVVNYSSMLTGESRNDFKNFLELATDFIKCPNNFKLSMALVATKVETSRSDEKIIDGIAHFLETTKAHLDQVFENKEKQERAAAVIDILLSKDQTGNYNRITFFRQPQEAGPLEDCKEVMESLKRIKSVLYDKIEYSSSSPKDFGISISPAAKLMISTVSAVFNQKIEEDIKTLGENVRVALTDKVVASSLEETGYWLQKATVLEGTVNEFSSAESRNDYLRVSKLIFKNLGLWKPENMEAEFDNMERKIDMLTYFESIGEEIIPVPILDWSNPWKDVLKALKTAVIEKTVALNFRIEEDATNAAEQIKIGFYTKLNAESSNESKLQEASSIKQTLSQLIQAIEATETLNAFLQEVKGHLEPVLTCPINSITLEFDIETESPQLGQPSVFNLLLWTRPFQDLLVTIELEIKTLETLILEEQHKREQEALEQRRQEEEAAYQRQLAEEQANLAKAEEENERQRLENERISKEHEESNRRLIEEQQRLARQQQEQMEALQKQIRKLKKRRFLGIFKV